MAYKKCIFVLFLSISFCLLMPGLGYGCFGCFIFSKKAQRRRNDIKPINLQINEVPGAQHSVKISVDSLKKRLIDQNKLQDVIHNSLEIVKKNKNICFKQYIKDNNTCEKNVSVIKKHIKHAKYPELCGFNECGCIHRDTRVKFEDIFVSEIEKLHEKEEEIVYVGFGAGSLFPDLRILSMVLQEGIPVSCIHLIDIDYTGPKIGRNWHEHNGVIQLFKLFKKLLDSQPADKESNVVMLHDLMFEYNFSAKTYFDVELFIEFVEFLSQVAGKKIDLYIHGDVQSYLDACKNGAPQANVATIMDYMGQYSMYSKGDVFRYDWTCYKDYFDFVLHGLADDVLFGELSNGGVKICRVNVDFRRENEEVLQKKKEKVIKEVQELDEKYGFENPQPYPYFEF